MQDNAQQPAEHRDNNALAGLALSNIRKAVVLADREGRITLFNAAAERISGYSQAEVIGKKAEEVLVLKVLRAEQPLESPFSQTIKSDQTVELPQYCFLLSKTGESRPVSGHADPVAGPDGQTTGAVLCMRDITEELASRKMHRLLSKTIDVTLRAVTMLDSSGVVLHANPTFVSLWGYNSSQELEGRPFGDFFQGQTPLAAILKTGNSTWRGELWAQKKDGAMFYVDGVFSAFFDDYDGKMYVLASLLDATERRLRTNQLISSNLELLALTAATNAIISITDKSKLWKAVCEQATSITGADHAWLGLLVQHEGMLQSFCCSNRETPYLERLPLSAPPTPELMALETMAPALCCNPASAGMSPEWAEHMKKMRAVAALSLPVIGASGEPLGVLTILSSEPEHFTEQRIELYQVFSTLVAVSIENLRILSALELKVEDRTRELRTQKILAEEARILAESANKAKSEFLANMSHELRTPLNVVIGCSDIISEEMYGPLNPKQHEYQSYIKTSAQHLLSLINDILDLSKIEYGKMDLRPTDIRLCQLLENIVKLLGEKSLHAKVKLRLTPPQDKNVEFRADERKLKQIIFNLTSNAIKFSKPNSEVLLKAEIFKDPKFLPEKALGKFDPNRGYIVASVQDFGIGIKPADVCKLFQAFTQLETSHTREHEGSGLGLALTKKLVELHSGVIWVESEEGKGSTFTFVLPQALESGDKNA